MVNKCIISTCNSIKAGDGITLHKLPSNSHVQPEWFRAILNETGQTVFSEDDVICSKHFSADCFTIIDGKTELISTAVPFAFAKGDGPQPKRVKKEKDTKPSCSVFSCENTSTFTEFSRPQLYYHRFPKEQELIEKWKQFCNKIDNDYQNSYVCSDHFVNSDYVNKRGSGRTKTLKSDAYPSIYKRENPMEDQSEMVTPVASCTNIADDISDVDVIEENGVAIVQYNGKVCVVHTCQSRTEKIPDLEFFSIPSQLNTRRTWVKLIQANTKQIDIPNNAVICSFHFTPESFDADSEKKKKILLPHAVPSIFPKPKLEYDEFPVMNATDFCDPDRGKKFYEWSLKNHQEQKKTIKFLKEQATLQARKIARLAKSVDEFKAKKFVSEEANNALQDLFDKIIDAQYEVI